MTPLCGSVPVSSCKSLERKAETLARNRIKLNSRGIDELLTSSDVRDELTTRAERALAAARASAPVDTGSYRASLHIEQDTTDRAVVRVVAGVPYAIIVEADTGTLARALDAAGGA